jgi:E-phenylitaconyl-CoA hydratase
MATALDLARRVAANAPLAVQAIKELSLRGQSDQLATGLRLEQFVQKALQASEDAAEGRQAFAEKRPPRFTGK